MCPSTPVLAVAVCVDQDEEAIKRALASTRTANGNCRHASTNLSFQFEAITPPKLDGATMAAIVARES